MESSGVANTGFFLFLFLFVALPFVVSIAWAYADAKERGKPGCLVALFVAFFSWPLSLVMWIIFRPEKPRFYE